MPSGTRALTTQCLQNHWLQIFFKDVLPMVAKFEVDLGSWLIKSMSSHGIPLDAAESSGEGHEGSIAIVGMSCRFPGANNADEFWNVLAEGSDGISYYPSDRPPPMELEDDAEAAAEFQAGFLKCPIDAFDAKFFRISPKEAPSVDPQQRILLEVAWEALENASINPQSLRESNASVFTGMWQADYYRMFTADTKINTNEFYHRYLGNAFSATSARLSHFLDLNGPNAVLESGCSSSLQGLHSACESLRTGESNLAISAGINIVLSTFHLINEDGEEGSFLSRDYRCKTFDETANGFVRAEGCGVLILKRIEDAKRDGDNILALVRGSAYNNCGGKTSFGTPNASSQIEVIRQALQNSEVSPGEVSYVEAHGTGTAVGDPTEMYAIGQAYSTIQKRPVPLLVSSVKSNIGHTEACAGLAGVIKVILSMQHNAIPPHLNLKNLNHRIDLESIPARIPLELTAWTATKLIAGVSSFGLSGTNVHVILEEPPRIKDITASQPATTAGQQQILTMSAKSEEALNELRLSYVKYFQENPSLKIDDVAYCANSGRAHLPHGIAVVGKDVATMTRKLQQRTYIAGRAPAHKSKIAFLFTGQGSQYFGMAKNLYAASASFRNAMDECDHLFNYHFGVSLQDVLWNQPDLLALTIYCQPAIFCVQYSLLQVWTCFGIRPDFVIGHSVGEFCAAVCAEVLTLRDAMMLVVTRSRLVNELPGGRMMVVKSGQKDVELAIERFQKIEKDHWVDVAAINSPEEVVISCAKESLSLFSLWCTNNGLMTQEITAAHAFHSRAMDSVLLEFGKVCGTIKFSAPTCTFVTGTLAKRMEAQDFSAEYWTTHLRDTVRFSEAMKQVLPECKIFLEVGTQPILLGLTMANFPDDVSNATFCPSLRKNEGDMSAILSSLSKLFVAGVDIDWREWFGGTTRQRTLILPNYPFQREKYWCHNLSIKSNVGAQLHPILGRQLPSPLRDTVFFNTLLVRNLSYMEDHKVAEHVIVPAAAYLDTIMAAGRQVLQAGHIQVPLTLENFEVLAAIHLDPDNATCHIQTIVESNDSTNSSDGCIHYEISIHKQLLVAQPDKWKRHSCATFSPSTKLPDSTNLDIEQHKNRLEHRHGYMETLYNQIRSVGIEFGPKFQSIVQAWSGDSELLTQVLRPEHFDKYICHPIVLDAMIQTFAYRTALSVPAPEQKELLLPVRIKKFSWMARGVSETIYIHAEWASNGVGNVSLYNETGEQLASMEGLEFISTNVDSFLRSLRSDQNQLPHFLREIWQPTLGATEFRVQMDNFQPLTPTSPQTAVSRKQVEEMNVRPLQEAEHMSVICILKSIQDCGLSWPPTGTVLCSSDWNASIKVHVKFVQGMIDILISEGYVEHKTLKILRALPTIGECEEAIRAGLLRLEAAAGEDEIFFRFSKRCYECLSDVMSGKVSAESVLFPEDDNEVGAIRFFCESKVYAHLNNLAVSMIMDRCAGVVGKGMVRILEVGAGSGVTCEQITSRLHDVGISYHYACTDISSVLVSKIKEKFKDDKNICCEVLDIEKDPLSQGFVPNHYDIVLGAFVVHVTADLAKSLQNLKTLIKDGGQLLLPEQFKPEYKTFVGFGMLDGYWRFTDFRTTTPLVDWKVWERLLTEAGFNSTQSYTLIQETYGVVSGRASTALAAPAIPTAQIESSKTWILFSQERRVSSELRKKLKQVGRNTIMVTRTDQIPTSEQSGQNQAAAGAYFLPISAGSAEFTSLLETFLLDPTTFGHVEGIVYSCMTRAESSADVEDIQCDQKFIVGGLLHFCQTMGSVLPKLKSRPKVVLLSRGVYCIGDDEPANPLEAAASGLFKTFGNEYSELATCAIDMENKSSRSSDDDSVAVQELFAQLWKTDQEYFVALRNGKKFVERLVYMEHQTPAMNIPNVQRFKVLNPESGNIADLQVMPWPQIDLTGKNIEVVIAATALNFKDLFVILKPEGFELPQNLNDEIGLDFAGTVGAVGPEVTKWKVGDQVFGFTMDGALASHIVVPENEVLRKPVHVTFEGACTLPVAFGTAYHALVNLAKLTAQDRVLIHVASGGVGLAAVQIAQYFEAEIFATAGSKRKRAYLSSLGIKNIYHSRNTKFGMEILKDTKGAGVSVVLNCLTGPNFKETSLSVCCPGARFVEIGKVNTWTTEEVTELRPDVRYSIFDLGVILRRDGEVDWWQEVLDELDAKLSAKDYRVLPHVTFPLENLRQAFQYFQEAKHIGKIVVTIPSPVPATSHKDRFQLKSNLFNSESTYLITGGLGGLGMEVAHWMTTSGARHIVLAGRNAPSPRATQLIKSWNAGGANILALEVDVGEYDQCCHLLNTIKSMELPPLRGIMHAAGVISDATIPNQSWEKCTDVFKPKVYGGWYLHHLTKSDYDLEFFVMFSSAVAIAGALGQSNHAGANRFLDSLANHRNSIGLPAKSVNWGPWSDVGAAAHIKLSQYAIMGLRSFSPAQGIAALERIMREPNTQVCVLEVSDWTVAKTFFGQGKLLDEISSQQSSSQELFEKYKKLAEEIKASRPEERQEKIEEYLTATLRETLHLPEKEQIDPDLNFSELGVDSLMAIEMRNRVRGILDGKSVTLAKLQENRTIRSLAAYLASIIDSEELGDCSAPGIPVSQQLNFDSILPDDIRASAHCPLKPSQFRAILLTGATGHLGSHILDKLMATNIKIYTLIRAKTEKDGRLRLEKALKKQDIDSSRVADKVKILVGNVVDEKLGLGDEYNVLADTIDAIVHCAVKSSHLESYSTGGTNDMRSTNVVGLINMLRFAGSGKTKQFLHASTLVATMELTDDGHLSEEYPSPDPTTLALDRNPNGYVISKCVGERLVSQASDRGIPITTIRYPPIFGHSVTGRMANLELNHGWSLFLTCLKVQMFPKLSHEGVPMIPVDTAAQISLLLFLSDSTERGVYNLTTHTSGNEETLKELRDELKFPMEFATYPVWRDAVLKLDGGEYLGPLLRFYEDGDSESAVLSFHPAYGKYKYVKLNVISEKMKRNIPGFENLLLSGSVVLRRHLKVHFSLEKDKKEKFNSSKLKTLKLEL